MNYKKILQTALIAMTMLTIVGCPDDSGKKDNSTDMQTDYATPDIVNVQNNSILISESSEKSDGVIYTVKSYATVYAECEYLYDYYRLYYFDNKVRKIVYAPHSNLLDSFDYTYKELDKNENYLKKTERCFVYIYSENGKAIQVIVYYQGQAQSVSGYYESGIRKSYTAFSNSLIGESHYDTDYYYDKAEQTLRARFSYSLTMGTVRTYSYYYMSGYCQYYYGSGCLYEYDDNVTTNPSDWRTDYKSKTVCDNEWALAKFEQIIGDKVYKTTEPDSNYLNNLITFTVVLDGVPANAAAVALFCNVNEYKADNVNGRSAYIADVTDHRAAWTVTDYPLSEIFSFQFVPMPDKDTRMGDDWWCYAISGSSQYENNKNCITCDFRVKGKGDGCTITVSSATYGADYWDKKTFPIYRVSSTRWFNENYTDCFMVK